MIHKHSEIFVSLFINIKKSVVNSRFEKFGSSNSIQVKLQKQHHRTTTKTQAIIKKSHTIKKKKNKKIKKKKRTGSWQRLFQHAIVQTRFFSWRTCRRDRNGKHRAWVHRSLDFPRC